MEMVEDVRFFPNCTQNTLLEDQSSSQLKWELEMGSSYGPDAESGMEESAAGGVCCQVNVA